MRSFTEEIVLPANADRSNFRYIVLYGSPSDTSVVDVPPAVEVRSALVVYESAIAGSATAPVGVVGTGVVDEPAAGIGEVERFE